jgi:hypothetical protein
VPETEKDSVAEMIAEFLREAAVLVLVFVPLELYKRGLSVGWLAGIIGFSLGLLAFGIVLERIRPIW